MKLLRITLLSLALIAIFASGAELFLNVRGPSPGPDPASETAGRALLRSILEERRGALPGDAPVRFRVTCQMPFRPPLRITAALDPRSRSADVVATEAEGARSDPPGGPEGAFRYDGATETVTAAGSVPADGNLEKRLRAIMPSVAFWSLVPWILDDPGTRVWRMPDAGGGRGVVVRRIAVRWPGELDWFVFEIDGSEPILTGVEFVDARATMLLRWRGDYDGSQVIDRVAFPETWRFRPARPFPRLLTGGGDLFVFR